MAAAPTLPPVESTDSFAPDFNNTLSATSNGVTHAEDFASSPTETLAPSHAPATVTSTAQPTDYKPDPQIQQKVQDVLHSDIGVNTLLNRLKASIASAKDFASCLKRRGQTEEEHAASLKKLSRMTLDSISKPEGRHESFKTQFEQVLHANERIADNGTQFGLALHAMHENLLQLATKMEGSRKTWKQQGLSAEQKVQDAEKLAEKAKAKYNQLSEDLDKVKTGDSGAGRKFGLKGPKSAAQHEEDLHRKVQAADQDYASKIQTAQASRKELITTLRPQAVAALVDLIKEIDAALTMEMQKFASFNEKLVVNNGQVVSPQAPRGSTAQPPPSINQMIYQINNDKDFDDYVLKFAAKVPAVRTDLTYAKHPTQGSNQVATPSPVAPSAARQTITQVQNQAPSAYNTLPEPVETPTHHQSPPQIETAQQSGYQPSYSHQQHPQQPPQQPYQSQFGSSAYSSLAQNPYGQNPHQGSSPAHSSSPQSSGVLYKNSNLSSKPPLNPVFGVSLDELFARDGSPVPAIVYQCTQAVDMYGLEVEGIYRIPGTASHIQAMKNLFDTDASQVDFRNPEAFQHDVNSVAGLLKQWFRELPDPLLTRAFYERFIEAARKEDATVRRDMTHAAINELPDPNYATLRALMLHLHHVVQSAEVNRMTSVNLSICWAPAIMGSQTSNDLSAAGLQSKVVNTILDHVMQIFDED
ncbi:unnamed protein product [Periconia digitata]|uniref:GTPase activating protein n=1 Tax=Periconia digitata TaxID=1303443 RepID=A0A9W4UI94_9PLEO|nr:unnamed protein product [Periconia digitata]